MRVQDGHTIVCDGKYMGQDDELVPCGEELHPATHSIINQVGVLGHHCDFCHSLLDTRRYAEALGFAEHELRRRFRSMTAVVRAVADKAKAEAAEAEEKAAEVEKKAKAEAAKAEKKAKAAGSSAEEEAQKLAKEIADGAGNALGESLTPST